MEALTVRLALCMVGRLEEGMIQVEYRRHSIKDGVNRHLVGPRGMELARLVGGEQLRGRGFTQFHTSSIWRTTQTLVGFEEGAGDFLLPENLRPTESCHEHLGNSDHAMELWHGPCRQAEIENRDMVAAAIEEQRDVVDRIARESAQIVIEWMRKLPESSRVLCVGHSPSLEFIALGMFDQVLPQLGYCDGFRVILENGDFRLETVADTPTLDASPLLARTLAST